MYQFHHVYFMTNIVIIYTSIKQVWQPKPHASSWCFQMTDEISNCTLDNSSNVHTSGVIWLFIRPHKTWPYHIGCGLDGSLVHRTILMKNIWHSKIQFIISISNHQVTLRPRQNGCHSPMHFPEWNVWISITISLKIVFPRVQLTTFQYWFR